MTGKMYTGEDRILQCDSLEQLASDLASGLVCDTRGRGAQEIVEYWEQSVETKPSWYNAHNHELLVEWTAIALDQ